MRYDRGEINFSSFISSIESENSCIESENLKSSLAGSSIIEPKNSSIESENSILESEKASIEFSD